MCIFITIFNIGIQYQNPYKRKECAKFTLPPGILEMGAWDHLNNLNPSAECLIPYTEMVSETVDNFVNNLCIVNSDRSPPTSWTSQNDSNVDLDFDSLSDISVANKPNTLNLSTPVLSYYSDNETSLTSKDISNHTFTSNVSSLDSSMNTAIEDEIENDVSLNEKYDPFKILRNIRVSNINRLTIGQLNINSIRNKFEALKSIICAVKTG